jgi:toxin CcdB
MARFDVYLLGDGGLALDCQDEIFEAIGTRFVVPLMPIGEGPPTTSRLHPQFEVNGEPLVMITELATAIRTSELRSRVASLAHEQYRIIGAIDVLTGSG